MDICLICNNEHAYNRLGKLCLVRDHDHKTGYIRGILCSYCNSRLDRYEALRDGKFSKVGKRGYEKWVARYADEIEIHLKRNTGVLYDAKTRMYPRRAMGLRPNDPLVAREGAAATGQHGGMVCSRGYENRRNPNNDPERRVASQTNKTIASPLPQNGNVRTKSLKDSRWASYFEILRNQQRRTNELLRSGGNGK